MKKILRVWGCAVLALLMLLSVACNSTPTSPINTGGTSDTEQPTEGEPENNGNKPNNDPPVTYDPPIIWDFSSESAMIASGVSLYKPAQNGGFVQQGVYSFDTVSETKVLSLQHELYSTTNVFPSYRFMFQTVMGSANPLKDTYCWIRVTYQTTDPVGSAVKLVNNSNGNTVTLFTTRTSADNGFIVSEPISLEGSDIWTRILNNEAVTFGYDSPINNSDFCIKEIAFFNSEKAAYAYYGDDSGTVFDYTAMTFGSSGTAAMYAASGDTYGIYEIDEENAALKLGYAPDNSMKQYGDYCAMPKFNESGMVTNDHKYVRVLYSAQNPAGMASVSLSLRSNANPGGDYVNVTGITNTNGEYVLTDTLRMKVALSTRISSGMHVSLVFSGKGEGGDYRVKAIYFFKTKAEADSFTMPEDIKSTVTINGQPLSSYSIVVPSNAVTRELNAATSLQGYFYRTSGVRVPIVTDTEKAVGEHEILLGLTNRTESQQAYAGYLNGTDRYAAYNVKSVGNKIVFATFYNPALDTLIPLFARYYLHTDDLQRPESFNVTNCELTAELRLTEYNGWSDAANVSNPNVFTDDFSGESYWMEEGTNDAWTMSSGTYVSSGNGYELTYLHVYEKNSVFSADLKAVPKTAGKGSFGLQLRYTSEYGYVRGGYDYESGCWYIETREGEDFTAIRVATKAASLTAGQTYRLTLKVENGTAKLSVDGTEILSGSVTHVTPGRIAVYAYDVAVTLDNVNVEFSSGGMGQIIQGIVHTVLPGNAYLEGGSVIELNDEKLHYIHHSGAAFVSSDNGASWEEEESWYIGSYASVFRLQNGNLVKTVYTETDVTLWTSKDEGKTWTNTGKICDRLYAGSKALNAGNMNDKMFQSKAGRLLYVQSYESKQYETINGKSVLVCCEIYYSDDNGATWTRSKTSSHTMSGMNGYRFGEGKIIECEGGVLRFMVSWSDGFDTIVYSESTDGGVTWGAIHEMEGFDCGRSSMAIVKDPNGPTDYTYYMVWCYGEPAITDNAMPRSRLALAYTTDGKNWKYMGDIWWWESNYSYNTTSLVNHIVDPFIYVTDTHVIIGTGISERSPYVGETVATTYHYAQRQHIWAVDKDELSTYDEWPGA